MIESIPIGFYYVKIDIYCFINQTHDLNQLYNLY